MERYRADDEASVPSRPRTSRPFLASACVVGTLLVPLYLYGFASSKSLNPGYARREASPAASYVGAERLSTYEPLANLQTASQSGKSVFADRLLGIEVRLPLSHWVAMPEIAEHGRIITLNNFQSNYLRGGFIPRGGAEISLVADASMHPLATIDSAIDEYLDGDKPLEKVGIKIAGCSAKQVESVSDFAPKVIYRRMAVFMPLQHKEYPVFYKFFLTYNGDEDDALGKSFKGTFSQLLSSIQLIVPTAGCVS